MEVQLLDHEDARWPALLARVRHDIDHLPGYLAASDRRKGTTSLLAHVSDGDHVLAVPLRFIELPGGMRDAASAELRAAPLFTEGTSAAWRSAAIRALLDHLRDSGTVSLFLRFHPLLEGYRSDFAPYGAIVEHGPTYDIPLDHPLEEIRANMRRSHRQSIRKFRASEFRFEREPACDDLPAFHELYELSMQRVHARDEYHFSLDYFEDVVVALGDHVALWVLRSGEQIVAAHLVTDCGGIVQGLYAGVHSDFHARVPQVGLYDQELEWAQATGHRDYFIGGAGTASLHQFKAGITKVRPAEYSARIVVDHTEFGRRCDEWQQQTGLMVGRADEFFPPYRDESRIEAVAGHSAG